ncbi:MAG TPA: UDP-glucuronic acid decarboxylase family protein [Acidimicrobiia bacterium]|nr:UDP-glucuronic acid decarboxylase family protein [Acidimicrobiia bacterium]
MSRIVVTGGAGFLGSHLCRAFVGRGDEVVAVDNLLTGRLDNLSDLADHPRFTFLHHDVTRGLPIEGRVDGVLHFASPASPPEYLAYPFETLDAGSLGTRVSLELAREHGARFLLASTSEVYGDPEVHPQPEDYRGNVNPIGPRSVYDESKRFAETVTITYHRHYGLSTGIVRIFNTYGPGLRPADGRVVSNFLDQAISGAPLTVYGDGSQTRSFCYVDDEIDGILALFDSTVVDPVNIGNPEECTVLELARLAIELTGTTSEVVFQPLPADDPARRRPDITRARTLLGWEPTVDLPEGLTRMHAWFVEERARGRA